MKKWRTSLTKTDCNDLSENNGWFKMREVGSNMDVNKYSFIPIYSSLKDGSSFVLATLDTPYSLPSCYATHKEKNSLLQLAKRNVEFEQKYMRKDMDALSADWRRVGECINEGIIRTGQFG